MSTRRRNRNRHLIPEPAIGRMSAEIQQAQARVRPVVEASDAGRTRIVEARVAVEQASTDDAERIAAAARARKNPPPATAPKAEAELQAAIEARKVLDADEDRAIRELHRTIGAHAREAVDGQQPVVESLRDQGRALLEHFADVYEELAAEAGTLATLASADEYTVTRGAKRFKRAGHLSFPGRRRIDGEDPRRLVAQLVAAVEALGQPIEETTGEAQDREQREREERPPRMQRVGDGVFIPG